MKTFSIIGACVIGAILIYGIVRAFATLAALLSLATTR